MAIQVNNSTRIQIEQKSVTQDAVYGTEVITWIPLPPGNFWAEVQDVLPTRQQAEQMRNGTQVSVRRTRVRIRYRTDVDASMRCLISGVVHQIVGGPAEIGRHEWTELLVERASTQ